MAGSPSLGELNCDFLELAAGEDGETACPISSRSCVPDHPQTLDVELGAGVTEVDGTEAEVIMENFMASIDRLNVLHRGEILNRGMI